MPPASSLFFGEEMYSLTQDERKSAAAVSVTGVLLAELYPEKVWLTAAGL